MTLWCLLLLSTGFAAHPATIPDDQYILDSEVGTDFGEGICGLGDVNADGFDDFGVCVPGKVHSDGSRGELRVYLGGASGVTLKPNAVVRAPAGSDSFAYRLAGGDLNRDGFGDALVLGIPRDPTNTNNVILTIWAFLGSKDGLQTPAAPAFSMSVASGPGGFAVIGDVNGDGFTDFAVGLPSVAGNTGEVLIFHGNVHCAWKDPDTRIVPSQPGEYFGFFGKSDADFNDDGFDDLVIGSNHFKASDSSTGRAQLFLGSKSGLSGSPAWTMTYPLQARDGIDEADEQYFANFIVSDDFNRDGRSDVVLTAPFAEQHDRNEGIAFGYYGVPHAPGLPTKFNWSVQANRAHAVLGLMAEPAGDVNGDGFPDLLLGGPDFENNQLREGIAAVFLGSKRGLSREPVWTLESQNTHARLGNYGAGVGDLNNDGFDDLVIAQKAKGDAAQRAGGIWVIYGTASGPRNSTGITFTKPIPQWLDEEWARLSVGKKGALGSLGVSLMAGVFAIGRQVWRKRTIILVERRERASRAEERERLARDLHDEFGSRLTKLHLVAEMVRRDPDDPSTLRTLSETVTKEAKGLRGAIEEIAFRLSPESATTDGIIRAITRHAQGFFAGTEIRCFNDLPVEIPATEFDAGVRDELFPCVKEAFANVVRHSRATEVWLTVRFQEGMLEVSVRDNGAGFAEHKPYAGQGLRNFEVRMARIGGKAQISSSVGQGTCVSFRVRTQTSESDTPPGEIQEQEEAPYRSP